MQSFNFRADAGTEITVDAPEGAFPEGTKLTVSEEQDLTELQALIDADEELEGVVVAAADISFYLNGEPIQPRVPVYVSYASAAAVEAEEPKLIHIGDDNSIDVMDEVTAETVEASSQAMQAMSGFGAAAETPASTEMVKLSFQASSFSYYAILGAAKAPAQPLDEEVTEDEQNETANDAAPLTGEASGISVSVTGAPEGAKLVVSALTDDQAANAKGAIQTALNTTHAIVSFAGVDISFTDAEGTALTLGAPVDVTLTSEAFKSLGEDAKLYHIADGTATAVQGASIDREAGTITFSAKDFSPYVTGEELEIPEYKVTVKVTNVISNAMYDGHDAEMPAGSMEFDFSKFPFDQNITSENLCTYAEVSGDMEEYAVVQGEKNTGKYRDNALWLYRLLIGGTETFGQRYHYDEASGSFVFQYRKAANGDWINATSGQSFELQYVPYFKYVKFDPNNAYAKYDTEKLFEGVMTVNGVEVTGEYYIKYKFFQKNGNVSLTTGRSESPNFSYIINNPDEWPTNVHIKGQPTSPTSYFRYWHIQYNCHYGQNAKANTAVIIYTDALNKAKDDLLYDPLIAANYRGYTNKTEIPAPYDRDSGYPVVDGKPQGSVSATKTAQWVDKDSGIAKIILTVEGTTVKKGSDVVIILDQSASMTRRFGWNHVERESQAKIASWHALDILLEDETDNNRVAFASFRGDRGPEVWLRPKSGRADLETYLKAFTADEANTNYLAGLTAAHDILSNGRTGTYDKSDRKAFIIFISDGAPNGTNYANMANTIKNEDKATAYAIGIEVTQDIQNKYLLPIASDASKSIRINSADELDTVLNAIAKDIAAAGTEAVFTDTISQYFDALSAEELAALGLANTEGVTVDGKVVTVDVGTIDSTKKTYEIYVKVADSDSVNTKACETNDNVRLNYVSSINKKATSIPKENIGDPVLTRGTSAMQIKYYRVNASGQYLDATGQVVGDAYKTNALVGTTLTRNGLSLDNVSSADYTVYCDVNETDSSVVVDNGEKKIWGAIPDGYILWEGDTETKTVEVTADSSNIPVAEFKLFAPYTVNKITVDKKTEGYAAGEEIHYQLTITSVAEQVMMNVVVNDSVVTPQSGMEEPGQGTIRFEVPADGNVTFDESTKTFTIKRIEPNGTVTIDYYYTVAEGDVTKVIRNMAFVNGVPSPPTEDPTRIVVTKVWNDSDDRDHLRPDSVTIHLLANRVDTGRSVTLNENNNWSGGFKIEDATKVYTVSEDAVTYYKPTITGTAQKGFTVTNTLNVFYVYHSSDNTVDIVPMPESGTFDLTAKVKDGYLYGGYYANYQKKGSTYTGGPALDGSGAAVNGGVAPGGKAYTGGALWWAKGKAFQEAPLASGEGGKGTEMTPAIGATYYLKEVPSVFLKPMLYVIYDAHNEYTVVHNYLLTDVDDNNYNDIGLYATNITTGDKIRVTTAYTITDSFNGKSDTIKAATFGARSGYVAVWKPELAVSDFVYTPYFKTPDGVIVEGSSTRTVTIGTGKVTIVQIDGVNRVDFINGSGFTLRDDPNSMIRAIGNISTRETP